MSRLLTVLALATSLFAPPHRVSAQEMGQGEANITARANVQLALESGPATNSRKLAEIGEAVSGSLSAIRQCYRDVVQRRPTVQGSLRLLITAGGGGEVEIRDDQLNDAELARCSVRALRTDDLRTVRGPGSAYALLTYANSAAAGVAATQERRAVEDQVDVTRNAAGNLEARGGNESGEIAFVVEGTGGNQSEAQVAAMQRSLRAAIPILLDCRRKSARRSSPAGEITLLAVVPRRGRTQLRMRRNTVADERGHRCLTRFLGRHDFEEAAAGRSTVTVTFTGNEAIPVHAPGTEPTR